MQHCTCILDIILVHCSLLLALSLLYLLACLLCTVMCSRDLAQ